MATVYFQYGGSDYTWGNYTNWWADVDATTPYNYVPSDGDDVLYTTAGSGCEVDAAIAPNSCAMAITVLSAGSITNGIFSANIENYGTINGGTFNNSSTINNYNIINGGTFTDTVILGNYGTITNGAFAGSVAFISGSIVNGGTFTGTLTNESNATWEITYALAGTITFTADISVPTGAINSGTYSGTVSLTGGYINNGTFTNVVDIVSGIISRGNFSAEVTAHCGSLGSLLGGIYSNKLYLDTNSITLGDGVTLDGCEVKADGIIVTLPTRVGDGKTINLADAGTTAVNGDYTWLGLSPDNTHGGFTKDNNAGIGVVLSVPAYEGQTWISTTPGAALYYGSTDLTGTWTIPSGWAGTNPVPTVTLLTSFAPSTFICGTTGSFINTGTIFSGTFNAPLENQGNIEGGTFNANVTFKVNSMTLNGADISEITVTADGVTVTKGVDNTFVDTVFVEENSGHFVGFSEATIFGAVGVNGGGQFIFI